MPYELPNQFICDRPEAVCPRCRIAHYDYWSDKVRRSVLPDSKADLLIFGNGDKHLIPAWSSSEAGGLAAGERSRQTHGAGTPDKFKPAPGKSRIALGGTAAAPKATAVESKIRPSILSTIKTKAKPAAAPMGRGKPPAKAGAHAAQARGGRK